MEKRSSNTFTNQISSLTRRDIIEHICQDCVPWSGRLQDVDFLSRLYDLENMPSYDSRFQNASQDIIQHRVANYDWEDDWVFSDERFNFVNGTDENILKFLCEIVHPEVLLRGDNPQKYVDNFNQYLKHDNYEIFVSGRVSGKPIFSYRKIGIENSFPLNDASQKASELNWDYMNKQINRMENSLHNDPDLAIGTSKEFIETICKSILTDRNITIDKDWDVPRLTKETLKSLQLLPENISDESKGKERIKRMLQHLSEIPVGIAQIRNLYGTGHGKDGRSKGLQPRHAKLCVGMAATLGTFLFETDQYRKELENHN